MKLRKSSSSLGRNLKKMENFSIGTVQAVPIRKGVNDFPPVHSHKSSEIKNHNIILSTLYLRFHDRYRWGDKTFRGSGLRQQPNTPILK